MFNLKTSIVIVLSVSTAFASIVLLSGALNGEFVAGLKMAWEGFCIAAGVVSIILLFIAAVGKLTS
jgi:hypothetical protein